MTEPETSTIEPRSIQTVGGCLIVLFANVGGYGAQLLCAVLILMRPSWQLTPFDAVYGGLILATLAAQHMSERRYGDTTRQLRFLTQAALHLTVSVSLWGLAQSIHLGS